MYTYTWHQLSPDQQTDIVLSLPDYEWWEIIYSTYEFDDDSFSLLEGMMH